MEAVTFDRLRPGQICILQSLSHTGAMRRRLLDLGFQPGCKLRLLWEAPSGSPMAMLCKGAMIALRREDCRKLLVRPCHE